MPIRQLDVYANERQLNTIDMVDKLRDLRIGVDAGYWIRRILTQIPREPCVVAMSGLPLGFEREVEKELRYFKECHIHPTFVFGGITPPIRKDKPFSTEDRRPLSRQAGWDAYEKGRTESAMSSWIASGSVPQNELHTIVSKLLAKHGFEYIRAPYGALYQLSQFELSRDGFLHAVYAGNEYLLNPIERVITGIDFQRRSFTMIEKPRLLMDLGLKDEQFLDACILAGFEYINTFPPLLEATTLTGFNFRAAVEMVLAHRTGFNVVQHYAEKGSTKTSNYKDSFCRARSAIKHHLILSDDGQVEPLHTSFAPNDLQSLFGPRFPDDVYFYLTQGLISASVLSHITMGIVPVAAPLCNGESQEYRNFIKSKEITSLHVTALNLIRQQLHPDLKNQKIAFVYWFDPAVEVPLPASSALPSYLWQWQIPSSELKTELNMNDRKRIDLAFTLGFLANPILAKKTLNPRGTNISFADADSVSFLTLCKVLQIRGYVAQDSHQLTLVGKALFDGLQSLVKQQNVWGSLVEELIWAIDLIRLGALSMYRPSKVYDSSNEASSEDKYMFTISLVVSILSLDSKAKPWSGPLSRDLLAFNSYMKAVIRPLRHLSECLLLNHFIHDKFKISFGEDGEFSGYFEMGLRLPFDLEPNTAMGLIMHRYLKLASRKQSENSLEDLKKEFGGDVVDVHHELKRSFAFWNALMIAIKSVANETYAGAAVKDLFEADEWLKKSKNVI